MTSSGMKVFLYIAKANEDKNGNAGNRGGIDRGSGDLKR